jgi:hypothetical protein
MIDFVKDDEFSFWLPMQLSKSTVEGKEGKKRVIQGIASTKDRDLQKEVVNQNGIDFSYFLKYGYYNNDHKPGFENKVGQPLECKITKEGLWTRGFLFDQHKIADAIWELANALEATDADRKLGFSIQGKVTRRHGREIMKCWIQDIAITASPINTHTWFDVVKSLSEVPQDLWVCDNQGCYISPSEISPVYKSKTCSCDEAKSLAGGLAIDESKMDLKKDDEEAEKKKALSVAGGSPLTPESLDKDKKDQGFACKSLADDLSFGQCVDLLQEHRGLSARDAASVAETVFAMNGITL